MASVCLALFLPRAVYTDISSTTLLLHCAAFHFSAPLQSNRGSRSGDNDNAKVPTGTKAARVIQKMVPIEGGNETITDRIN